MNPIGLLQINIPENSSSQAIPRKIITVKSFGVGARITNFFPQEIE
jgi:hypothetical protein